jgi:hypothetical protein
MGVSVAIIVRGRESRPQGEGPHRERRQVANTRNVKAWESSPMSVEHERQKSSPGVAVCGESRTHGDNGGDGKTQVKLCVLSLPIESIAVNMGDPSDDANESGSSTWETTPKDLGCV